VIPSKVTLNSIMLTYVYPVLGREIKDPESEDERRQLGGHKS